jgi:Ca2+-binding RTX toxin-like protein
VAKHVILACFALVAPLLAATPAFAAGETCEGRPATHVGTTGNDVLRGTSGDDVMVGLDGDDQFYGFQGNDVICGDGGSDDLYGHDGDDRLFGGLDGVELADPSGPGSRPQGDLIVPGPGNDHVDAGADPVTMAAPSAVVDTVSYLDLELAPMSVGVRVDLTPVAGFGVTYKPTGIDRIVVLERIAVAGSRANDVLIGSPHTDVLAGAGGTDVIHGGAGDDSVQADGTRADIDPALDGPDNLDGGAGADWVYSGQSGGTARGGPGYDNVAVGPATGRTTIFGDEGPDSIKAVEVDDVAIHGGPGSDTITFSIFPEGGAVEVDGGGGSDEGTIKPATDSFVRGTTITLDQARGTIHTNPNPKTETTTRIGAVSSLESVTIKGGKLHWRYRGTNSRDRVFLQGGLSLNARTRGGSDSATGTQGRDVLDLGRGRDVAIGRRGRDTCIAAEQVIGCEVRR